MAGNTMYILFIVMVLLTTSVHGATFKGKVIDSETKAPIAGAVVVASWHEETATISGASSRLKDVKEALTDQNGEWRIEGPRGREGGSLIALFSSITGTYYTRPPEFIIFKPGYCSWPAGFTIDACKGKLKPEGNDQVAGGKTAELPKLTNREDRMKAQGIGPIHNGRDIIRKQKNFIRLLNLERQNIGLSELLILKELNNDK